VEPDLDAWLPEPQLRIRHRCRARAAVDPLWQAAESISIRDTHTLGRLVRWRIPGISPDETFSTLFRSYPFALLASGERWSVSGLCGRLWTLRRDYPHLDGPEAFLAWQQPGTVRVALAHWVEPDGDAHSVLVSESRVQPVDGRARVRTRALWAAIGGFERLIGAEALHVAARRAETTSHPAASDLQP
jgi:hypothetical protein